MLTERDLSLGEPTTKWIVTINDVAKQVFETEGDANRVGVEYSFSPRITRVTIEKVVTTRTYTYTGKR